MKQKIAEDTKNLKKIIIKWHYMDNSHCMFMGIVTLVTFFTLEKYFSLVNVLIGLDNQCVISAIVTKDAKKGSMAAF